jgi:hypothetical protein
MLHTRDDIADKHRLRRSNFSLVMKSLLMSAWKLFKAFVINARDVLGSGRINL